ncbi:MAG: hypothetical protein Q9160_005842 [Pyrenula sp. 1 TL-2023]
MPTPESPLFLSKKPTVPPTFEGVDFSDTLAVHSARDAIIREQWVHQMMARLVREELGKCYIREGVNHLERCGKYRERYLQLLKENREKGYRGKQQNYVAGVDGPEDGVKIQSEWPVVGRAKGIRGTVLERGKGEDGSSLPGGAREKGRIGGD